MSVRIRETLRQNVIGLLALFVALGGTASALQGKNTVDSGDIKDDQVKSSDVRDDTLSGGGLGAVDLKAGSVGASEVATSAVGTDALQDNVTFGTEGPIGNAVSLGDGGITLTEDEIPNASINTSGMASFRETSVTGLFNTGASIYYEAGPYSNPDPNQVLLYARESGGQTQLVAHFADGDIDVIAQEAP